MARKRPEPSPYLVPTRPTFTVKPRNQSQRAAARHWADPDTKALFLVGFPGGGKTTIGLGLGVEWATANRCQHLAVCRPAVDAGEKLGYDPGSESEKLMVWMGPFLQAARAGLPHSSDPWGDLSKELTEHGCSLVARPVGKYRGLTIDGPLIVDEAQNLTWDQITLLLTRVGVRGGRVILCGDTEQTDLDGRSPLAAAVECYGGLPGAAVVAFTEADNLRSPWVKAVVEAERAWRGAA